MAGSIKKGKKGWSSLRGIVLVRMPKSRKQCSAEVCWLMITGVILPNILGMWIFLGGNPKLNQPAEPYVPSGGVVI